MSTAAGPETVVAVGAGKGDTGGGTELAAGSGTVSITATTSSKNLLQQLPAGAVLAFQALASTFTNQGNCYASNWWLTLGLVTVLSATCVFFSFTDSIFHNGKVYYGVATPGRLNIINMRKREERRVFQDLKPKKLRKLGLRPVDWVHALLSLVVFLTVAGSDVGLQNCFFPKANDDTRQLLRNLPLGMAVMSSFLFMIFPTTRKGIRFDNSSSSSSSSNAAPPASAPDATSQEKKNVEEEDDAAGNNKEKATDRAVMSSANLLKLLPTGPVLAFQTLAASFTNQGSCYHSNWWLTVGLVVFLSATCIFSSFTDCVQERDTHKVHRKNKVYHKRNVHKGVALPGGLHIIGMSKKKQRKLFDAKELRDRRLKTSDWIHAFFSAVVFLAIAGSDVGLQNCFFRNASDDTRQLLKNLPLGMAVMSSFVFTIFPTTRNSFCFDDYGSLSTNNAPAFGDEEKGHKTTTPHPTASATTPSKSPLDQSAHEPN